MWHLVYNHNNKLRSYQEHQLFFYTFLYFEYMKYQLDNIYFIELDLYH